jgi:hypothetical protein
MDCPRMTGRLRLLLLSALLGLAFAGDAAGGQHIPGIPGIESGAWIVRLIRLERTGHEFSEFAFYFDIFNREAGDHRTIKLANETTDVGEIRISDSKLVILGSIGGSADTASIFDLKSGELLDSFLCWWPNISEAGRFIVAVRFYPRSSDPALTSHVVVLYQLSGSPKARSSEHTENQPLEPIYPPESARLGNASSLTEKETERHFIDVKAGYAWDTGDRRVAFVDRYENDSWLVVVELEDGHAKSSRRLKLDVASVLGMSKEDARFAETLRSERAGIPISGLHWAGENAVVVDIDRCQAGQGHLYRSSQLVVNLQ